MLFLCGLFIILADQVKVQAIPGLVLPEERTTGLGCIPEGETLSYECTVTDAVGIASTVWLGSAFNCSSAVPSINDRLSLPHGVFTPAPGVFGSCGDLSAMSVGVNGSEYTSRLTLTATSDLDGATILCTISNVILVGNDTVRVRARPPSPQQLMVSVTSDSSLTVSWSPPSDASNVASYRLNVTGECGNCADQELTGTSVPCSGWTGNGQTCSFEVRTVSLDCGLISEPVDKSISLTVPWPPTDLSVTAVFTDFGTTASIDVWFTGVVIVPLGGNLDPTIIYTVIFTGFRSSRQFTGVICNSTNHCSLTVDAQQLSLDRYIVSVVASNIVGSGPSASYPTPVQLCLIQCDPEVFGSRPSSQSGPGSAAVTNGVVTFNGVIPGSVATLDCDSGYAPGSLKNRTCQSDGRWSEGTLSCMQTSIPVSDSLSNEASIAIAVVLTFLLTLVLGVTIGALSVWGCYKCRRSDHATSQPESQAGTEMRPTAAIYEDVEDVKPDPSTEGNLAYGHVHPLTSRH